MTAVSLHKDPGDAKLSTAEEQPRRKGPCPIVFRLSAILGWSAMAIAGFMAMAGEMFESVTLLTVSVQRSSPPDRQRPSSRQPDRMHRSHPSNEPRSRPDLCEFILTKEVEEVNENE